MDLKTSSYIYTVCFVRRPRAADGVLAVAGRAKLNGTPKPPRKATGPIIVDGLARFGSFDRINPPHYILHGTKQAFEVRAPYFDIDTGLNVLATPLNTRLVMGTGGRKVPWGILQEVVQVDDGDVQTWTATDGPNTGKTVGVSLINDRVSVSLSAIFLRGVPPPKRGNIVLFKKADGTTARLICLKITHQWATGQAYGIQVEGTEWEGGLSLQ